ncbi:MAG: hypothetical protein QXK12_04195 [Candidatus Nezhaarchaeales archaeon]
MFNSEAFTMIGGRHTVAVAKQVGVINSISYALRPASEPEGP